MQGKLLGIRGCFVFVLLLTCFSLTSFAQNGPDTLVLKDGTRIAAVTLKVDKFYKVIRYRTAADTKDQFKSFTDIEAIIGPDGLNHASELLEESYRPSNPVAKPEATPDTTGKIEPPEKATDTAAVAPPQKEAPPPTTVWRHDKDAVYKKARQRFWSLGLRLAGNASLPAGDWYTGVNSGIGFEGDLFIALSHDLALRFTCSRAGLNVDDNFYTVLPPENSTLVSEQSSLSVTRYFLSAVYYQRGNPQDRSKLIWHVWTGLGAISHKMGIKAVARDNESGDPYALDVSSSTTKFAMTVGGGAIILLSKHYGLDFSAGMDVVSVGTDDDSGGVTYGYIFDLKIGFITLF